jgi:hypothetical protein
LWPVVVRDALTLTPVLVVYLTGLVTQDNVTATGIATQVGVVSHDELTRMLRTLGVGLSLGACLAVRLVQALGVDGWLIIDDVLIPKPFARAIAFCAWDHDHSQHRHVFGMRLVFVVWCCGSLTIPLLFTVWQKDPTKKAARKRRKTKQKKVGAKGKTHQPKKKRATRKPRRRKPTPRKKVVRLANGVRFRTKNELARAMVWKLVRRGLRPQYVLFDNWYASDGNLALFHRLHLHFVTRAKCNYRVQYDGQTLTVSQVAATVRKANYHYYAALRARARSFEVTRGGRTFQLVVIKDDRSPEAGRSKFLLTDDLRLTTQAVVDWYRRRWPIEVFFRDAKQLLGLTACEARAPEALLSHYVLVCVAYTLLQLLKPLTKKPHPSVCTIKHALAALLMLPDSAQRLSVHRQLPNACLLKINVEDSLNPIRTRLPQLTIPKLLVFP